MIANESVAVSVAELRDASDATELVSKKLGRFVLRWVVSRVDGDVATIEATTLTTPLGDVKTAGSERSVHTCVVSLVPTGIGCAIGGYAGDASGITALLGTCVDYVVTNPNAVNASDFVGPLDRVLYTEGACIDLFARGRANLWLPTANRVGVVLERSEKWKLDVAFNVINAVRAIHSVDVVECVVTDEPIGSRSVRNPSGAYVGTVDNPDALLRACDRLVARGVTAIAVASNIQDLHPDVYAEHFEGRHPNPMGGVEAVISHLLVERYGLPAAHAPMINLKGGKHPAEKRQRDAATKIALHEEVVDPRGAGELVSASGLACVLIGLRRAPQLRSDVRVPLVDFVGMSNAIAVVAPAGALGGVPVLCAAQRGVPIIAVEANETITDVNAAALGLEGVVVVRSYAEAAGVLLALRHGISLESITRPLRRFGQERSAHEDEQPRHAAPASEPALAGDMLDG